MKRIITYGSFDLLHYGHIELLRRAKAMGDYLIVALSTDEFSASKGKRAYFTYEQRKAIGSFDRTRPCGEGQEEARETLVR